MKIRFLDMDEVLHMHARQLEAFGGTPGIRDLGALQSALAMPEAGMGEVYFHQDLWAMASAYLFHLCQNHPFIDGNKRVALASCRYFLHINGESFEGDSASLLELALDTAKGKLQKPAIASYLKKHSKRKP